MLGGCSVGCSIGDCIGTNLALHSQAPAFHNVKPGEPAMIMIALLSLASTCYAFDSTNASTRAALKANETDSYYPLELLDRGGRVY